MDTMQAIRERVSCRAYDAREIEAAKLDAIEELVSACNADGGLRMALVRPEDGAASLSLAKAMFSGQPAAYVALVAGNDDESRERLGFFGEKLALLACRLGLGSCWVAGTYKKETAIAELAPGEELHGIMTIGYAAKTPLKQRTIRAALRRRDKKPAEVYAGYDEAPEWIRTGIDAVIAGPSAVNGQPWVFEDVSEGIAASLPHMRSEIELVDLGIAKLHFQLGAESQGVRGSWSWGSGGVFKAL